MVVTGFFVLCPLHYAIPLPKSRWHSFLYTKESHELVYLLLFDYADKVTSEIFVHKALH